MRERIFICRTVKSVRNFVVNNLTNNVMKLVNILTALLLSANIALASCSSSKNTASTSSTAKMERTITIPHNYSGIETRNGLSVIYKTGATGGVTICKIDGPADLVDRIEAVVKKNTLLIHTKDDRGLNNNSGTPIVITVLGQQVQNIETNSGSNLKIDSELATQNEFSIHVNSGAVIGLNKKVSCKEMTVDINSGASLTAGNVDIRGSLKIVASSGAIIEMKGKATTGTIDASSGAIVELGGMKVTRTTTVNASSGAIVTTNKKVDNVTVGSGAIVN